jgi:hypothetical protein
MGERHDSLEARTTVLDVLLNQRRSVAASPLPSRFKARDNELAGSYAAREGSGPSSDANELAPRDPSVKLFAAIEDYLQAKEATANSKRTIEFDRERLEIVKRHLGDVKLTTITRKVIEGFQAKRRLEGSSKPHGQHGCRSAAPGAQTVQAVAASRR